MEDIADIFNNVRFLFDLLPIGVLYCDRGCIIRYVNQTYADLVGVDIRGAVGRHVNDFFPNAHFDILLEGDRSYIGTIGLIPARKDVNYYCSPVMDAAGKTIGGVIHFQEPALPWPDSGSRRFPAAVWMHRLSLAVKPAQTRTFWFARSILKAAGAADPWYG